VQVSGARIPREQAGELTSCFGSYAQELFDYAIVLTRGDRALAEDLVQSAFAAAAAQWATVRDLSEPERLAWLRTTTGTLAGSAFRRHPAFYAHDPGRYDLAAGQARFTDWLRERTADPPEPAAARMLAAALRTTAEQIMVTAEPVPDQLVKNGDEVVIKLYRHHYRALVQLASLLVRDEATAEELVQECFITLHDGWRRRREEDKALAHLKQLVVSRSRSVLRHRGVVDRKESSPVISALQALPEQQRQALLLRHYANLSEAQIAEMMGISKGAVKSHTARGMSRLRAVLEQTV
jgi:DNA-directed RNA polymerase specialized sigma24 family protein